MPTVPILTGPSQSLRPTPGGGFVAPDTGAAARSVGQSASQFGEATAGLGEAIDRRNAAFDEARAKDLDNQYQTAARQALYDPEHGYLMQEGSNALSARADTEQHLQQTQAALLAQTQSKRERFMLQNVLNQRTQEAMGTIARHADEQLKVYQDQQSTTRIGNATEAYATHAISKDDADRQIAGQNKATIESELADQAQRHGWSGDVLRFKKQEAFTSMHTATAEALMLRDPQQAADYLKDHAGEIAPTKLWELQQKVAPLVADQQGKTFADQAEQYAAPLDHPLVGTAGAPPNANAVWQRMIGAESGGHQLDSRGQPLTSRAGAMGRAQLMPGTAAQMERDLGLPAGGDRYKTDAAYNTMLGQAYFGKLLTMFGGDVRKAVAAYNAGPGGVQRAMRRGPDWENHLPAETQGYLAKVLGSDGHAVLAPSVDPTTQAEQGYAAQLQWAEKMIPERMAGSSPREIEAAVDAARKEIARRYQLTHIQAQAQENEATDKAYGAVANIGVGNFTSLSQIPGSALLPQHLRMTLENLADANVRRNSAQAKAADVVHTDWQAYEHYRQMPVEQLRQVPITELAQKLGKKEIDEIIHLRVGKPVPPAKAVTVGTITQYTKDLLQQAGYHAGNPQMKDWQTHVGNFTNRMMTWAQQVHDADPHSQWPDQKTIRAQADHFLIMGTMSEPGSLWGTNQTHVPAFEAKPGVPWTADVPDEALRKIVPALTRHLGRKPTGQEVRATYIAGHGGGHW